MCVCVCVCVYIFVHTYISEQRLNKGDACTLKGGGKKEERRTLKSHTP